MPTVLKRFLKSLELVFGEEEGDLAPSIFFFLSLVTWTNINVLPSGPHPRGFRAHAHLQGGFMHRRW